ncbi:hypothetical protein IP78_03175 [Brevundimonas sp. AAP58]|uniref:DUF2141 domain-containing protein n=1 Tax=Brevundimonas sp. AAP58 TaxID=1523422 RepID=UPI0006B8D87C|nr:DUF2141 domain-containing protein [Brevundimonas sp. AAP58]KPF83039.1 hypothetical protein IP78_03175 [Brevundimonas sp. AAP58]
MIRALTLIAALALPTTSALAQSTHSLTVTFEPGRGGGAILMALHDGASYVGRSREPVRQARLDVVAGELSVVFEGLEAGEYGITAFHDVNGNGEMDTNPFGMPVEPYAFSNNAVGNMGPARWEQARFTVQGETTQTISIR